jgi:hypothetical protein
MQFMCATMTAHHQISNTERPMDFVVAVADTSFFGLQLSCVLCI